MQCIANYSNVQVLCCFGWLSVLVISGIAGERNKSNDMLSNEITQFANFDFGMYFLLFLVPAQNGHNCRPKLHRYRI